MTKIDVRIPFEPDGRLGWDYNRIFSETLHDWVLVIDHDIVLNTNPLWYSVCQRVIDLYPDTGLFTCKTNARHRTFQRDSDAPQNFDLTNHQIHAKMLWDAHGLECQTVPRGHNIAGFFMLIRKTAWQQVNGFRGTGMFEEDWDFTQRLHAADIPVRVMCGLYVMHGQKRQGTWDSDVLTSKEIYEREILKR